MKVTTNLISRATYSLIGNEVEVLLMIIFMHYNGVINDKKMFGMFKGLRLNFTNYYFGMFNYFPNYKPKNTVPLLRRLKTYHCKISDRWYNDEGMYTILQETFMYANITKKEMDSKTFMSYLNKFFGKGKGFCYDFINREIIENVYRIFEYNFDFGTQLFQEMGLLDKYKYPSYYNFEASGYCCDDCDGDYEQYKKSQYTHSVINRMKEEIKQNLTKKTK